MIVVVIFSFLSKLLLSLLRYYVIIVVDVVMISIGVVPTIYVVISSVADPNPDLCSRIRSFWVSRIR